MKATTKKRIGEYIFVILIFIVIAAIYAYVINDVYVLLRAGKDKQYDIAKDYLRNAGFRGGVIVSVLEMLQMIVVFVPAEFVQVSAGLAFPVYIALPVCLIGICAGASVIFLIVRCLHIRLSILEKRNGKISELVSQINKDTPMSVIMYILFIMPAIPFGAIAYFASSSKMSYRRYILTCATGTIPSVLSSYILGNVIYRCLGKGSGVMITAVTVIIILAGILLIGTAALLKKKFFKKTVRKPAPVLYKVLYFFINLAFSFKFKTDMSDCEKLGKAPALILGAHTSFYDFYFAAKAVYPRRINVVTNRYYFSKPYLRPLLNELGAIPKSLFTNDFETVKSVIYAAQAGYDIAIFPEGRLSTDGTGFDPAGGYEGIVKLIKKIGMPVYFFSTDGGYFAAPKWRKNTTCDSVKLHLKPLLTAEEIASLPCESIAAVLRKALTYDASITGEVNNRDIRGLEKILYKCPSCGSEYTLSSRKDALICGGCGREFVFDNRYTCDGRSISALFAEQKRQLAESNDLNIKDKCRIRCFNKAGNRMMDAGEGVCGITDGVFIYSGTLLGESVKIEMTPASLQALAFSCGEEFEFYYGKKLIYFYPENGDSAVKWSLIWDILAEKLKNNKEKEQVKENRCL